jgi:ABC-2 type transport system ATP-binding protein
LLADLTALPTVKAVAFTTPAMAPPPATGEEPKEAAPAARPDEVLVKIEVEDSRAAMVDVFSYFNERDISFTSVDILEPNLENVFLHLTGKKLRE